MRAPLLISSMTGGAFDVARINLALAEAAQALGLAMGVGSQRSAIRDQRLAYTYQVRQVAPKNQPPTGRLPRLTTNCSRRSSCPRK